MPRRIPPAAFAVALSSENDAPQRSPFSLPFPLPSHPKKRKTPSQDREGPRISRDLDPSRHNHRHLKKAFDPPGQKVQAQAPTQPQLSSANPLWFGRGGAHGAGLVGGPPVPRVVCDAEPSLLLGGLVVTGGGSQPPGPKHPSRGLRKGGSGPRVPRARGAAQAPPASPEGFAVPPRVFPSPSVRVPAVVSFDEETTAARPSPVPAKPLFRRRQKRVSFGERVEVGPVLPSRSGYSREEKERCWFTREDYRRIHAEASAAVVRHHRGNDAHQRHAAAVSSSSIRGLEKWWPKSPERAESLARRKRAIAAVLEEQQQQQQKRQKAGETQQEQQHHHHSQPGMRKGERGERAASDRKHRHPCKGRPRAQRIREAYRRHTAGASDRARAMGAIDEANARHGA
ncbi:unnamed protein product [Pseudo-nitzschia multistriata]|uniref:Uncharacterized protein n=1 Tax=Pseudo-nitzschia multistriata TaxID=183589 RepID=A0A448ZPU1_9STRA|nr:unnamed protein product [Pseudo-nitzschia multistriata]